MDEFPVGAGMKASGIVLWKDMEKVLLFSLGVRETEEAVKSPLIDKKEKWVRSTDTRMIPINSLI